MKNIGNFLNEKLGDHFSSNGKNDVQFDIFEGGKNGGKSHNIIFHDLNVIGINIKDNKIYSMNNDTIAKLMAVSRKLGERFFNVYKLKPGESWFDKDQNTVFIRYKW